LGIPNVCWEFVTAVGKFPTAVGKFPLDV